MKKGSVFSFAISLLIPKLFTVNDRLSAVALI